MEGGAYQVMVPVEGTSECLTKGLTPKGGRARRWWTKENKTEVLFPRIAFYIPYMGLYL